MNKGYVKIRVTGKNPKLFLKRYIINKIKYDKYKKINRNEITFRISYENYLYLKEKESMYDIVVVRYYGLIKYFIIFKNNFSFIICFIFSIVFLIFISSVCFDLEIVHNDSKIRNLVKEELNSYGIKRFSLIPNFSKRKKIINKILKDNKEDLEWLEIERLGSKLVVKITERKINKKQEQIENRHIVAKKSGIIKKIEASSGVIVKKKNDYVEQGDIIVSGDIIKDETVKGQVVAKGVVYAETWYNVKVEYPLYYEEVRYLDEMKNNYILDFLNKSFSLKKKLYFFLFRKEKNSNQR